jgi:hypothetical protein
MEKESRYTKANTEHVVIFAKATAYTSLSNVEFT